MKISTLEAIEALLEEYPLATLAVPTDDVFKLCRCLKFEKCTIWINIISYKYILLERPLFYH